jgi:dihydropteroate synthase
VLLELGRRRWDLTHRSLVMAILNRTRDSFYDGGRYLDLDALLRRAAEAVEEGADVLDVGARPAGVGVDDVPEQLELERVAETVAALVARFDVAVSVDTWRASVAVAGFAEGATLGNDMSGFSDPGYLEAARRAGAAVVATHIRLAPQVPDPAPRYGDVVHDVRDALAELVARARAAGLAPERIVVDPGLDLGKTWRQSLRLLARLADVADLGQPVLLAASHKIFLGRALGLDTAERDAATVAACAWGASHGARVLRVHDTRAARHAADLVAALQEAR